MNNVTELFSKELEICKNNNTKEYEYIEKAICEFVTEFNSKYGYEYDEYLFSRLKDIIPNIDYHYYAFGGGMTGESGKQSIDILVEPYKNNEYTINILKHELWHILNNMTDKEPENLFDNIPKRYSDIISKNGMDKKRFIIAGEQWNEYFNKITHREGMKTNFYTMDQGFYFKQISTQASYDYTLGVSDGIVALTELDDFIKIPLDNKNSKSKKQLVDIIMDFDTKYIDCLDEEEKEKYKYPYLKLELNADDMWVKKPNCADTMMDAYKTMFKAYNIKLNDIEGITDISELDKIYDEIKSMQSSMPYNINLSKMKEQLYIKELEKIQSKVISLSNTYRPKNKQEKEKLKYYAQNISYENECKIIENEEDFVSKVEDACNSNFDKKLDTTRYECMTSDNGIKDNIYKTIKLALGNDYYKFVLQNYDKERQEVLDTNPKYDSMNILLELNEKINQIPDGDNSNDTINKTYEVFDIIYLLMLNKMKNEFPLQSLDANVCTEIERMLDNVNKVKSVSVYDKFKVQYHDRLEDVFDYAEKYTSQFLENKNNLGKEQNEKMSHYALKDESQREEVIQQRTKMFNLKFQKVSSNLLERVNKFKKSNRIIDRSNHEKSIHNYERNIDEYERD